MRKEPGFTLIETIIYLALFAIVIGGGMIATYQILASSATNNNHVIMEEEANFLLRKINWALTSASGISLKSGTDLEITKNSIVYVFNLCSSNLVISTGTGTNCNSTPAPIVLNSSNVTISSLSFQNTPTGTGIITSFTLKTIQAGETINESFSTTKYLRQ